MRSTVQIAAERPITGRAGRIARALTPRAIALPAVTAALLLGTAAPSFAAIGIDVEIAPPPPPTVVLPAPRAGFVWAPGYWRWNGRRHVWVGGHWLRARPGFHWVPEHWNARRGRYHFVPGHWARG